MVTDDIELTSRNEAPPLALWLIVAAAIAPFPISAWIYGFGAHDVARPSLEVILTWSALVLAFLAGVRWGLETGLAEPRWTRQLISVLTSAVAFIMLLGRGRLPDRWVIGGFIAAYLVQWLFDHRGPDVPARYPKLSTAITAVACVCLAICLDQAIRG